MQLDQVETGCITQHPAILTHRPVLHICRWLQYNHYVQPFFWHRPLPLWKGATSQSRCNSVQRISYTFQCLSRFKSASNIIQTCEIQALSQANNNGFMISPIIYIYTYVYNIHIIHKPCHHKIMLSTYIIYQPYLHILMVRLPWAKPRALDPNASQPRAAWWCVLRPHHFGLKVMPQDPSYSSYLSYQISIDLHRFTYRLFISIYQ